MSDALDYEARAKACAWFIGTLEEKPLGRTEALFVTPDAGPRRLSQSELARELREAGLSSLARRVEKALVPRGCVLVLLADTDVSFGVVRIHDEVTS